MTLNPGAATLNSAAVKWNKIERKVELLITGKVFQITVSVALR